MFSGNHQLVAYKLKGLCRNGNPILPEEKNKIKTLLPNKECFLKQASIFNFKFFNFSLNTF
jgi:hypothetical protein